VPTIHLTNNADLNLTATSADDNATLNRYLKSLLTFQTPPSFDHVANLLVKDQHELDFPVTVSATGEGTFVFEANVARSTGRGVGLNRPAAGRQ
jgi:hypothetical protein